VFLAYTTVHGRTLVDRELYLPRGWCDDAARRHEAAIATTVQFATKPAQGLQMLRRALDGGLPARWVTADEAYGKDAKFRLWLQARHMAYVLAVACNQKIPTNGGSARADTLTAAAPALAWKRRSCGDGAKGPRLFDWAVATLPDTGTAEHGFSRVADASGRVVDALIRAGKRRHSLAGHVHRLRGRARADQRLDRRDRLVDLPGEAERLVVLDEAVPAVVAGVEQVPDPAPIAETSRCALAARSSRRRRSSRSSATCVSSRSSSSCRDSDASQSPRLRSRSRAEARRSLTSELSRSTTSPTATQCLQKNPSRPYGHEHSPATPSSSSLSVTW